MNAPAAPPLATDLVGREAELAEFGGFLSRRSPAFVLVEGEAGIGKTTLVRAVQRVAAAHGWMLVPGGDTAPFAAGRSATPEVLAGAVHRELGSATANVVAELPRALAAHAPTLLVVELVRPTDGFVAWLAGSFLGEVRNAGAPVIVIATMTTAMTTGAERKILVDVADAVVRLGPLEAPRVREALLLLPALDPPLEEYELDVYVDEATRTPEVLGGLLRLLPRAAAETS